MGLKELLADAKLRIEEIAAHEAAALLEQDASVLFLDVRELEELRSGRIPGALHVPRGLLEPKAAADSPAREPELADPGRLIIAYCASGARSALATDSLQVLGFREVRSLSGGFAAWTEAGHPVEK